MERKKVILSLSILLIVMIAVGYFLTRDYLPPAPDNLKREMLQELKRLTPNVPDVSIVWFDENGGKRDPGVCRYFGTYGDCVVLLIYHFPIEVSAETPRYPYRISSTRTVMLPAGYEIMVFNRDPNCKTNEVYPFPIRISAIYIAVIKLNWLTDNQAEQIGRDLEDWVAKGNY